MVENFNCATRIVLCLKGHRRNIGEIVHEPLCVKGRSTHLGFLVQFLSRDVGTGHDKGCLLWDGVVTVRTRCSPTPVSLSDVIAMLKT